MNIPQKTPPQMTARYVHRLAIVYVRQSTERQVQENQGSTADQRDQAHLARNWGWPEARIRILEDLGLSGTETSHRPGFLEMEALVGAGEVGAIFVSDVSRLGRNAQDQIRFIDECVKNDVLIVAGGIAYDLSDAGQVLTQRVISSVAEFDNLRRRDMMMRGKKAKLAQGKAITRPPLGYVRVGDGVWDLDPDPLVQESIRRVFATYLEQRSLCKSVQVMQAEGVLLPRRLTTATLRWIPASTSRLADILHNRAYKGDYVYGMRRQVPRLGRTANGKMKVRYTEDSEWTTIRDHHPPYISREQWDEANRTLALNNREPNRLNPGRGCALVQGIIRCAKHNSTMATSYGVRKPRHTSFGYQCIGGVHQGGSLCRSVSGRHMDRAIRAEVLRRLQPVALDDLRNEWREAKSTASRNDRMRELAIARARREAETARERAYAIDPGLTLVARKLNEEWEAAEKRLKAIESRTVSKPSPIDTFTEESWEEAVALAGRVEAIWDAETTEHRDRKEIVRLMIRNVWIDKWSEERIQGRIVWASGTETTEIEILRSAYAHRMIGEMSDAGVSTKEIVARMNARGITNRQGTAWNDAAVRMVLWKRRKRNAG